MDSNDNPQGGPAPASPSEEAGNAGSRRREPGIKRPLGSDSSFPSGSPPQPTAQEPVATPRGAPPSRQFGEQRPTEQMTAGTRPAGAAASARPAAAAPRSTANPAAEHSGDGSGSPGSRPSERQPPPGPPGSDDADDGPDEGGKKKRTWKGWLGIAFLLIVIAASVFGTLYFWPDGSDGDVVADQPEPEPQAVDFCRHGGPASLDEVKVLRFSDQLEEGRINSLWSEEAAAAADAQTVLAGIVTKLFSTEGDGCTPPGAAYWRLVRPVSIDAGRLGVDDFDSATRIGIYEEDADTAMAVAVETASQLSDCADPQFAYLTAEEAPVIHVAAYTADYDDVVFVRTPLLEVDELPDGGRGLKVLRCSFGKVEGSDGDYVNDVLISPSLRAIIYLDSPSGVEVVDIVPDEGEGGDSRDLSDEDASETDDTEAATGEDASEAEDTSSSEADDKQPTADDEQAKTSTEEDPKTTESEDPKQTEEAEVKAEEEEGAQQPEGKVTTETEEESGQPDEPKVTGEAGQEADEKTVEEEQPEGGSGDGCDGTCGEDDVEPEPEEGGKVSGDDCEDDCPGEGGGSGDDCEGDDCPGDGLGSGDDCENGDCPGEGGGDDCQGDDCPGEGGDCEGDDCPGEGDCEGDDCPDEEKVTEPCPEGWLLDPFDNCKAPDPGPDGF